jgi:hypothetical protein
MVSTHRSEYEPSIDGREREREASMDAQKKKNELTREVILESLTDAEVAQVSRAEDAARLAEGDEYLDLGDPSAGVQRVQGTPRIAPGRALPRSSVSEATWAKIVGLLAP